MNVPSLRAMTWATVTGAVLSAVLLAAGENRVPELTRLRHDDARPASARTGEAASTLDRRRSAAPPPATATPNRRLGSP